MIIPERQQAMKKIIIVLSALLSVFSAIAVILYRIFLRTDIEKFPGRLEPDDEKWLNNSNKKDIYLTSNDGLFLHGILLQNDKIKTDKWVIAVHGYDGRAYYMTGYGRKFLEMGFNVLMPDLRGFGLSEGKEISMGQLEKYDIICWINKLINEYNADEIVLFGISMGAATAMLTAGEKLPENVKCIIEDAGYSSVREEFEHNIKRIVHIPPYPTLWLIDIITRLRRKWSVLKDADCIKAVKRGRLPILFIHGSCDDFVPFEMHDKLYEASGSEIKEKLVVYGARHIESVVVDSELYWNKISEFLKNVI